MAQTRKEQIAAYVADALANLDTLDLDTLDEYRRLGESLGDKAVLGCSGVSGHDFAAACDHEIAGRFTTG